LSLVREVLTEGINKEKGIYALSFSPDGGYLYAGGSAQKQDQSGHWKFFIRKWDNAGNGNYTDYLLMQNTVFDIKCLPNGRIAIIGGRPDIAVIEPGGRVAWYHVAGNNDYRALDKTHFRSNATASNIGFTPLSQQPVSVDIPSRLLLQQASINPPPTDNSNGTVVKDWRQSYNASINNIKISFLRANERATCVDINGDGSAIIIGGSWTLYKADKQAKKLWSVTVPATAWSVNISGNEKVVVAALGDGTIRWYSMTDGKELLAFYLHADQKRWILFTPTGYYDASPGAEDLLGWHVNHGAESAPSFYPVSRFKEQYYRPDIIDAILETYNEEQGIALADSRSNKKTNVVQNNLKAKLPPVVSITRPANGSTFSNDALIINYSLETPEDAPVKNIKVLVDGRPVAAERGVKILASNNYTLSLNIPQNDCTITLLAENDNGISPEANLYLKYKAPEKQRDVFVKKPKLYVLAIGISEYVNADYKLDFAADDAKAIVAALQRLKGGLYEDAIVKTLIDENATRGNMQDGLEWIQAQTSQHDVAMIFYAGRGINDNSGTFYMLPVNADVKKIRSTCLNFEELRQTVSNIAGKVVVFIDACHSGNGMGPGIRDVADINAVVNELSSTENGAVTFTSSTGKQYSLENKEWQHGAFTKALLEGFSGKAVVPGKNKITVKSLDAYVSERVRTLTNGMQHPTSVIPPNVPDFPIAIMQ
jgi:WD40 repeat protein